MREAIGMIETTSVGIGYQVQDAMLKAANVTLVLGRTICSGKFMNLVTGTVADVRSAVEAGLGAAPDGVIDSIVIPNVHESVFPALGGSVEIDDKPGAIGIIETYSAAGALQAADEAAKAAAVTLFRIHLAMALGGKGFLLMSGSVGNVRAAVEAGAAPVKEKGLLVSAVTIPGPRPELFTDYI